MKKRILFPVLVAAAALLGLAILWGSDIWLFIDLFALILVPGLATLYAFAVHGFKEGWRAFGLPFQDSAGTVELASGLAFFDGLGRAYLVFASLGSVVSLIDMLKNLADKTQVGPRLAVAMTSLEYAAILLAFLVIPFRSALARKLAALGKTERAA